MRIGERTIGEGECPYVIAEIGVNHDGSLERALQLTKEAADAGADGVKLQLFRTDLLMSRAARLAVYQEQAGESDPFSMLRRLELSLSAMAAVVDRAHALGIDAIVTIFSVDLVEGADRLDWDAYKTASPDIINKPLIDALRATGRPMIVSTGTATIEEVRRVAAWVDRRNTVLMQCVSSYPTPDESASLGGITAIARETGLPTGYSDHTSTVDTGGLSVAAGACILEKHLTHSRAAQGPDHAASLEPGEFREYVRLAKRAWAMLGPDSKGAGLAELDVRTASRQSIVARRDLPRGHTITIDDVAIKRPGTGVEPWKLEHVIGATLTRDVEGDMPLNTADLAGCAPRRMERVRP